MPSTARGETGAMIEAAEVKRNRDSTSFKDRIGKAEECHQKVRVDSETNESQYRDGRVFVSVVVSSQETEPEAHTSQLSDSE